MLSWSSNNEAFVSAGMKKLQHWAFERGCFNGVDIHLSLTLTAQLNQAEAGKLSLYAVFCIILVQLLEGVDV